MGQKGRPRIQPQFCSLDGCGRVAYAKNYCRKHYLRLHRLGDPGEVESRQREDCSIKDCGGKHWAKGFCMKHYRKLQKYGDPLAGTAGASRTRVDNPIPHGNRKYAEGVSCSVEGCDRKPKAKGLCASHYQRLKQTGSVGAADFQRHGLGRHVSQDGYVVLKWGPYGDQKRLEHRAVMEELLGRELLTEENVHHKNGVRHDNRPDNLELWVRPQPQGQRVSDLVAWVVASYPNEVEKQLEEFKYVTS